MAASPKRLSAEATLLIATVTCEFAHKRQLRAQSHVSWGRSFSGMPGERNEDLSGLQLDGPLILPIISPLLLLQPPADNGSVVVISALPYLRSN